MKTYIILGGGLTNNFQLNEHTKQRFDTALKYITKQDTIICSSDKSYRKLKEIRHTSEARVGKAYLLQKGFHEENIHLEEKSRDTFSNAYFCRKELIDPMHIKEFTVITSTFHLPKAKYVFDLVFPPEEYTITYIESPDGDVDKEALQNRSISEELILDFYKTKLPSYGITPGDLKAIKNYMFEHNPSFTGIKDKLHLQLTQEIEKRISGKDPLY